MHSLPLKVTRSPGGKGDLKQDTALPARICPHPALLLGEHHPGHHTPPPPGTRPGTQGLPLQAPPRPLRAISDRSLDHLAAVSSSHQQAEPQGRAEGRWGPAGAYTRWRATDPPGRLGCGLPRPTLPPLTTPPLTTRDAARFSTRGNSTIYPAPAAAGPGPRTDSLVPASSNSCLTRLSMWVFMFLCPRGNSSSEKAVNSAKDTQLLPSRARGKPRPAWPQRCVVCLPAWVPQKARPPRVCETARWAPSLF